MIISSTPKIRRLSPSSLAALAVVVLVVNNAAVVVSAFQPPSTVMLSSSRMKSKPSTNGIGGGKSTTLFYKNNATSIVGIVDTTADYAAVTTSTSARSSNEHSKNLKQEVDAVWPLLSFKDAGLREVDRSNLHPIFKLGLQEEITGDVMQQTDIIAATISIALVFLMIGTAFPILLPFFFPIFFVALRKKRWKEIVKTSKADNRSAFEANLIEYRQSQHQLVDDLLRQQQNPLSIADLPKVVAVTMATGQEGQGIVRALVEASQFQDSKILALVRNPQSIASQALTKLSPRIELIQCDSTDAGSLQAALQPAEAVFLCTTLNKANAGKWDMEWDGGQYQISQGHAFAEACSTLNNLKQIVYGTAPMRKWPEPFVVEPPIHYAAKWRVEQILEDANLPVTFLRKCPYHENFTKLTKATLKDHAASPSSSVAMMGVEGGGAFDTTRKVELESGQYEIKAFTPPDFTYNTMDPRDIGKWAVLAFSHPSILIGKSLSVASDALTGQDMAESATACGALGDGVTFTYKQQPRWLFESLAFVEPTFVYISGLQRWSSDGGVYDLDTEGVAHVRKLVPGSTWKDHLQREGLGQFTETMADLLPDFTKIL